MSGIGWKIDLRGLARDAVEKAAAEGLSDAAEFLLEQANRTVPIEESTLEGSGDIDLDEAGLQASVFYDTPYARRQHEDTRLAHDEGRRAKWLERTLAEEKNKIRDYVADRIKAALR